MTLDPHFSKFGRMYTTEQLQYIEDVLGHRPLVPILPANQTPATASQEMIHDLLVMTAPLNDEERALLTKILASVKIENFEHIESDSLQIGSLPDGVRADHILIFTEAPAGREYHANSPWWIMPPVASMIGANAAVVAKKKETWNWLQAFAKER